MKIAPDQISSEDFERYFVGSFVLDPDSGKPAILHTVTSSGNGPAYVRVHLTVLTDSDIKYPELDSPTTIVSYAGNNVLPFYDLSTYNNYTLGYKSVCDGKVLSYFSLLPASGGNRGITARKINIKRDLNNHYLFHQYVNGNMFMDSNIRLCAAVMSSSFLRPKEAIEAMLGGKLMSAVLNPDTALTMSIEDDCEQNPILIMYREQAVGKVSVNGEVQIEPDAQSALEEIFNNG